MARATQVAADFDRDGRLDSASVVAGAGTPLLRVWLSVSGTVTELRLPRAIVHVAALDLDGDGRPELVASDSKARLHIWSVREHGRVHPVHPRHRGQYARAKADRTVNSDTDRDGTALPSRANPHAAPLAAGRSFLTAPARTRRPFSLAQHFATGPVVASLPPRAPPAFTTAR